MINTRIHMQRGKSIFSAVFTIEVVMQTHFQSFILNMGPVSVCVLLKRASKRLSENMGVAGRRKGGILDAHLPFMGDANCYQPLIRATQQVFLLTLSLFFPIYCNLPYIKAPFLFFFPLSVSVPCLGSLCSSHVQVGGKGLLLLPTLAAWSSRQVEQMRGTGTVVSTVAGVQG